MFTSQSNAHLLCTRLTPGGPWRYTSKHTFRHMLQDRACVPMFPTHQHLTNMLFRSRLRLSTDQLLAHWRLRLRM